MSAVPARFVRAAMLGAAVVLAPICAPGPWTWPAAHAQAPDATEKAFNAAKELGTAEAWSAFLTNYPTGFHADLARAYLKKIEGGASPAPVEAATPSPPAEELSCTQAGKLKSGRSDEPVKIRFVNESEATLVIQWIDSKGALKEYAELQPGAEMTQDTFASHPWIAAYQEGSCRQLFLPNGTMSVARLRPEKELQDAKKDDDEKPAKKTEKKAADKPSKATVEKRAKAACVDMGMIYLNGKCAPKVKAQRDQGTKNKTKACPPGMYRNPYGQCQPNETGG
ncbi:hypothetical protein GIW81_08060 [Hyphomicrobium sp. xq]|uniref:von Hippel-Lindau disease tumour suppressor beta domain-containing protein n=1 Tax=Hyphomicrobium album TaxID=2665159 RepID=A0A6I3KIK5_9HYPH|nr:hypothetical protein [Hyphomicrobium album]MTD94288.1 hypothetical protein [Hyphomicrobium album]